MIVQLSISFRSASEEVVGKAERERVRVRYARVDKGNSLTEAEAVFAPASPNRPSKRKKNTTSAKVNRPNCKVAVVTGGRRDIRVAIAKVIAEEGKDVAHLRHKPAEGEGGSRCNLDPGRALRLV